ncbi:hypothetical protein AMS68_000041 [Peltaster fructicola]|uniref:SRR1-like domain-containing protein n=1 Tax=Peltaster fructicola TaxID=286661 RepID=A0A6H0XII6_9PEZI|nr:hypothetical protein AMS68_000041 [Peltaster fructicola]
MASLETDDWTFVPVKKGRKRGQQLETPAHDLFSIDNDATVDVIRAQLDQHRARWLKNDLRPSIFKCFKNLNLADRPSVTCAICMGVGSLCSNNLEHRGRSMTQLAVFLDIAKHLEGLYASTIDLYAQEPRLTAIDNELLTSLGFTTLHLAKDHGRDKTIGPAAKYINEHTFVADFFVDIAITQQMASFKIGLLTSALPMAIENGTGSTVPTRDLWRKQYRWCKLTSNDKDEPALSGLYACVLNEEEDTEE